MAHKQCKRRFVIKKKEIRLLRAWSSAHLGSFSSIVAVIEWQWHWQAWPYITHWLFFIALHLFYIEFLSVHRTSILLLYRDDLFQEKHFPFQSIICVCIILNKTPILVKLESLF